MMIEPHVGLTLRERRVFQNVQKHSKTRLEADGRGHGAINWCHGSVARVCHESVPKGEL